jgi:hypothetical protein
LYFKGREVLPDGQNWKFEGSTKTTYPHFTMNYNSIGGNINSLFWKDTGLTVGLYNKYWRNTIHTLDTSKSVKMSFRLDSRDINNLDFRKPIYVAIEGDGNYYHLERINNYNPDRIGSYECTLIKVVSPVPQVVLTGKPQPAKNQLSPIVEEQQQLDNFMVLDLPTVIIVNNVQSVVEMEVTMKITKLNTDTNLIYG